MSVTISSIPTAEEFWNAYRSTAAVDVWWEDLSPCRREGCRRLVELIQSRVVEPKAGAMLDGREWREYPR